MKLPRPILAYAHQNIRLLGTVGGCALVAGCAGAGFGTAKVAPASPIAAEVAELARDARGYPSFADIPAVPDDLRPACIFGLSSKQLEMAGARLERETAPQTWSLGGSEEFAAAARSTMPDVDPGADAADLEGTARDLRERATPPPRR